MARKKNKAAAPAAPAPAAASTVKRKRKAAATVKRKRKAAAPEAQQQPTEVMQCSSVADVTKCITKFLAGVKENSFNIEAFSTADGYQVSCTIHS